MSHENMNCSLCNGELGLFQVWRENKYYSCSRCRSIILGQEYYISKKEEKERYEEHNNDVQDKRYQGFVSPIVDRVLVEYKEYDQGLDFGSGTGPVITKLLKDRGYNINIYDPFFANYPEKLERKYDYIVCCEVVEHFHRPGEEFKLLKSLLRPGGSLYIMTEIYSEGMDFESWNYKNDRTHVFFYHKKALEWIKFNYGFSHLIIENNLIIYRL